jgi:hypothetical protein
MNIANDRETAKAFIRKHFIKADTKVCTMSSYRLKPMGKHRAIRKPGITPKYSGVLNLDSIMAGMTILSKMFSNGFSFFGLLMCFFV